ncbi:MAG TPA: YbaK/EbsC family protein [Candidatus Scybalocola faecipullorum]|nr:YbaK/EbsC family protein [Candidatus Scybalocola faecipullorum]
MAIDKVREFFKQYGRENDVMEFAVSSATVEKAAEAVGTQAARIAKTLSFYTKDMQAAFLIVTAGDMKIDNSKFKKYFGFKAKMVAHDDVEKLTGHAPGGVCPFANPTQVKTYLDISMQRFETVFPAAGSSNSAIELACSELEKYSHAQAWIDACKPYDA